jgi:hypothetical protein
MNDRPGKVVAGDVVELHTGWVHRELERRTVVV